MRCLTMLFVALAVGCTSDTTAPPANLLIGTWGGPGLQLTADRTSVHASFQCGGADFRAPLAPNSNGAFALPGTVSRNSPSVQIGAHGVVSGTSITIEVIRWYPGGSNSQQFTVTRDTPADLTGLCAT